MDIYNFELKEQIHKNVTNDSLDKMSPLLSKFWNEEEFVP